MRISMAILIILLALGVVVAQKYKSKKVIKEIDNFQSKLKDKIYLTLN